MPESLPWFFFKKQITPYKSSLAGIATTLGLKGISNIANSWRDSKLGQAMSSRSRSFSRGRKRTRSGSVRVRQVPLRLAAGPGASVGRPRSRSRPPPRRSSRRAGYMQTGAKYVGKIPFPTRKPRTARDNVGMNGSRGQSEVNLKSEDAHVTYLGVQSFIRTPLKSHDSAPYHVAAALLRYILKREMKWEFTNHLQTIDDVFGYQTNATYTIQFYSIKRPYSVAATGATLVPDITTPWGVTITTGNSFENIAGQIATNVICSGNFGAVPFIASPSGFLTPELYGYRMYDNASSVYGIRRLDNMFVKVNSYNEIFIQNQTVSDGNNASTDVIDSNPIKGNLFYFKDPFPSPDLTKSTLGSANVIKLLSDVNCDGIIYPDSSPAGNVYSPLAQIPRPEYFSNLAKMSSVILQPGEMKKFTFGFKFDGRIQSFITGLKFMDLTLNGKYQVDNRPRQHALGTSMLFAFEKMLSTGTGNPIVTYQINRKVNASVKGGVRPPMQSHNVGEEAAAKDDTTT